MRQPSRCGVNVLDRHGRAGTPAGKDEAEHERAHRARSLGGSENTERASEHDAIGEATRPRRSREDGRRGLFGTERERREQVGADVEAEDLEHADR